MNPQPRLVVEDFPADPHFANQFLTGDQFAIGDGIGDFFCIDFRSVGNIVQLIRSDRDFPGDDCEGGGFLTVCQIDNVIVSGIFTDGRNAEGGEIDGFFAHIRSESGPPFGIGHSDLNSVTCHQAADGAVRGVECQIHFSKSGGPVIFPVAERDVFHDQFRLRDIESVVRQIIGDDIVSIGKHIIDRCIIACIDRGGDCFTFGIHKGNGSTEGITCQQPGRCDGRIDPITMGCAIVILHIAVIIPGEFNIGEFLLIDGQTCIIRDFRIQMITGNFHTVFVNRERICCIVYRHAETVLQCGIGKFCGDGGNAGDIINACVVVSARAEIVGICIQSQNIIDRKGEAEIRFTVCDRLRETAAARDITIDQMFCNRCDGMIQFSHAHHGHRHRQRCDFIVHAVICSRLPPDHGITGEGCKIHRIAFAVHQIELQRIAVGRIVPADIC